MQDAKEILEFNKFMRKRLMEFYRLTKCPVPHSSMLFKRRKAFSIRISSPPKWGLRMYRWRMIIQPSIRVYRLYHTSCDWGIDGH